MLPHEHAVSCIWPPRQSPRPLWTSSGRGGRPKTLCWRNRRSNELVTPQYVWVRVRDPHASTWRVASPVRRLRLSPRRRMLHHAASC